jgi:hypothetical protein
VRGFGFGKSAEGRWGGVVRGFSLFVLIIYLLSVDDVD